MASGYLSIDVPKPVLTVEVDYSPEGLESGTGEHVARVYAGKHVLYEASYTSDYLFEPGKGAVQPDHFVHDAGDAEDRAINEFGEKLKKLLEG